MCSVCFLPPFLVLVWPWTPDSEPQLGAARKLRAASGGQLRLHPAAEVLGCLVNNLRAMFTWAWSPALTYSADRCDPSESFKGSRTFCSTEIWRQGADWMFICLLFWIGLRVDWKWICAVLWGGFGWIRVDLGGFCRKVFSQGLGKVCK